MSRFPVTLALLAVAGLCVVVQNSQSLGGQVTEIESTNQAVNNTRATAQRISSARFGRNISPNVYGHRPTASISGHIKGGDVDWYLVEAGPGQAYFDLDSPLGTFTDATLSLFNSAGTLLAVAEDGFAAGVGAGANDPGSRDQFDPFLGVYNIPASGVYYVALTERPTNQTQLPQGYLSLGAQLVRPDGRNSGSFLVNGRAGDDTFPYNTAQPAAATSSGSYTLHVSGNFATFGEIVSLQEIGAWGAALGSAAVAGGVDVRLTDAAITDHVLRVQRVTNQSLLPPFVDFRAAGTTLQAWDLSVLTLASQVRGAEIYFGYDEAPILAAGISESDLKIYHYEGGRWLSGGTVDAANNEIFFATTSLSPFVLGVVPEPSSIILLASAALSAGLGCFIRRRSSRQSRA